MVDTELDIARAKLAQLPLDVIPGAGPLPESSRMTMSRNPRFVGRGSDLRRIAVALKQSPAVVLTGADGVGKTQLAVEFARRFGRYFAGGVFWLSFSAPDELPGQMAACGGPGALDLRADFTDLTLEEQLQLVQGAWRSEMPRLLVYDDCEHEGLLREWLPTDGGARVLVTSRRPEWDGLLRLSTLPLGPLAREESLALLRTFRPDAPEGTPAIRAIAEELGDQPLALHLAGGFLRRFRAEVSFDSYLAQLRANEVIEHASWLGQQETQELPAPQQPAGAARSLFGRRRGQALSPAARAFALGYRWLEGAGPAGRSALAVLARAACFAPGEPIAREALLGTLADDGSLARLTDLGLLDADSDGALRLHPLLADFLQVSGVDRAARLAVEDATIAWARRAALSGDSRQRLVVLPHLDHVTRSALRGGEDERAAALCLELGSARWATGDANSARPHLERALAISEAVLGPEHVQAITSLGSLGSLLHAQGDLTGAQAYLERALDLAEETLGPDHPDTVTIINNLGWTLRYQGDLAGARPYLEHALEAQERTLGPDHPETAAGLEGMGTLLQEQGDLDGARPYLERALAVWERTLGPDDRRTLYSLSNLGLLLKEQGDLEAAADCLERALDVSERTLGPDHLDTATALDNMGMLLQAAGDLGGARPYLERALAVRENALGPDHPDTGASLNNLGLVLKEQGDLIGARPYLESALLMSQRVLGPYDLRTATSLHNLGTVLLELGDLYGAQPHLERALAIREQALGADHPDTASSLDNLGALLRAQGDLVGARTYFERALEIREEAVGSRHPQAAASHHVLGLVLRDLGDLQAARDAFQAAVAIRELVLGPDHPDTLVSITELDRAQRELGKRNSPWPYAPREDGPAQFPDDGPVNESS